MLKDFKNWYSNLRLNKFKNTYSPHKPLTILYALAQIRRGKRWIEYKKDGEDLNALILSVTNQKSKPNCLNPLHRLSNDSTQIEVWSISPNDLKTDVSGNITKTEALERDFKAGLSDNFFNYFNEHQWQTQKLIEEMIDDNFPATLSDDLLLRLGLADLPPIIKPSDEIVSEIIDKPKRDPSFPKRILSIYDYRCAFCDLKIYLNNLPLPLEAAHIKWKAQGGECSVANGLSLCPTHHFTFDRGLWSLDENYKIFLSTEAVIDERSDSFFKPFIGSSIAERVLNKSLLPLEENLSWHRENILKSS